jgi:hypothetical protein
MNGDLLEIDPLGRCVLDHLSKIGQLPGDSFAPDARPSSPRPSHRSTMEPSHGCFIGRSAAGPVSGVTQRGFRSPPSPRVTQGAIQLSYKYSLDGPPIYVIHILRDGQQPPPREADRGRQRPS